MANATEGPNEAAVAPTASAAPASTNGAEVFERVVFAFADELELPPRRARGALKRLVGRLAEAKVSLEAAGTMLEEWIGRAV